MSSSPTWTNRTPPHPHRRRPRRPRSPPGPRHTVYFVSDGTGITAETFGNSILSQFAIKPRHVRRPFIDSTDKAHQVVREINHTAEVEGRRAVVFVTLVNSEILAIVKERSRGLVMDMFNTFIEPLEAEFGITSNHRIGRFSDVSDSQEYTDRIESINFALAHDDGQSTKSLAEADVILVGVSRSGKTPTSLYLAMQHGIKAANYPLIPGGLRARQDPGLARAVQGQVLRPDHRSRAAGTHPQRAAAEQQVRIDRELPLGDARRRIDDEEGRHRLAVVDAQVDRGDRDDDPARPAARSIDVLRFRCARQFSALPRIARHAPDSIHAVVRQLARLRRRPDGGARAGRFACAASRGDVRGHGDVPGMGMPMAMGQASTDRPHDSSPALPASRTFEHCPYCTLHARRHRFAAATPSAVALLESLSRTPRPLRARVVATAPWRAPPSRAPPFSA